MAENRLYSKEEIQRILAKASEIQARKELYDDNIGLNEEEIIRLADEVGISRVAMNEALSNFDAPTMDDRFNWMSPNTRIQHVEHISTSIDEKNWERVVQEIRRETGGIGKTSHIGSSFEWEQRRSDIGYKHFSFTPSNNGSDVQMVSSWVGLKILTYVFSAMFPFIVSLILFKGIGKDTAIMIGTAAAILAQIPARVFLRNYYVKQKKQLKNIIHRISGKNINKNEPAITIDEETGSSESEISGPKKEGMRN
ncbi:hypothetical protein AB2B38_000280 [Balneola sp. MJW-20]|uniref:hypothetical protein n=1 Tax=Gracilimonas aurantiaca TaxID=3234185 RepID=UPI003466E263